MPIADSVAVIAHKPRGWRRADDCFISSLSDSNPFTYDTTVVVKSLTTFDIHQEIPTSFIDMDVADREVLKRKTQAHVEIILMRIPRDNELALVEAR